MRRTSAPAACADGPSGPIAVLSRRASQRAARVPTGRGGCYNPGHQRRPLAALARAPCRSAGSRRRRGLVPVAHGDRRSRPPALLCATRRSHALYPGRSPQECRSDRQRDPPVRHWQDAIGSSGLQNGPSRRDGNQNPRGAPITRRLRLRRAPDALARTSRRGWRCGSGRRIAPEVPLPGENG